MIDVLFTNNHPRVTVCFLLNGTLSDIIASSFEEMLGAVSRTRDWVIAPPELIDFIDILNDGREVQTYGSFLEIYSALPPWGEKLPRKLDESHLEEVSLLVSNIQKISSQFECCFSLQMDDTLIGHIRRGEIDRSIQTGLLDEWRKSLKSSR